jgi:phage portal protein BeeE
MFDRFRTRRTRRVRSDVSLVTDVLSAITASRLASEPIDVDDLPVVIGLVNLHADVIAALELTSTARGAGAYQRALERPNPEEPRRSTVHKLVQSIIKTGTGYVLTAGTGPGTAVTVLDPHRVTPIYDPTDPLRIAGWYVDGVRRARDDVRFVTINHDPRRGPLGRSPFKDAAEPMRMYGYAYSYLTDFFAGGGNPSTVLTRDGTGNLAYTNEQAARDWITARQERRPAVLPTGWKLTVPPNNGELEAVARILEHAAAEVARLLNAPPSLVNVAANGSMTYTNTAGEFRRWLAISLGPTWIGRFEDFWSDVFGIPVELDTTAIFRIVDPTENTTLDRGDPPPPRLEAVS